MITRRFAIWCLVVVCVVVSFAGGCQPTAKYMQPGFDPKQIDRVVVLPFIDHRDKPDPADNFNEVTLVGGDFLVRKLRFLKGYRAAYSSNVGAAGGYDASHLPALPDDKKKPVTVDREWVKRLGPPEARWVLVPVLDSLTGAYLVVYGGFDATVTIYLFDKRSGDLVWANPGSYGEHGMDPLDAVVVLDKPAGPAIAGFKALEPLAKRTDVVLVTDRNK